MINAIKTGLLLAILTGLILGGGYLIAGQQGLLWALILAGIMNFVGYFFSDKIALAAVGAQEVGPENELFQIVAELTQRAALPMPRVYIAPQEAPNAFATGRNPSHAAVCATQGLLDLLDHDEMMGVMGHELTHVRHRDILIQSVAATIAGVLTYVGYYFWLSGGGRRRDDENGAAILVQLLFIILAPIAAVMLQMAISRQREFSADTGGAQLCGDPMYLARALEKIHAYSRQIPLDVNPSFNSMFIAEPLHPMESVANLFSSHPPLEARLRNLIGRESTGYHQRA